MHSYEAGAGLLKFINESCLDQVRVNHLIPRGHVELMAFPAGLLRDRCVVPVFFFFFKLLHKNTTTKKPNEQFIITACHDNQGFLVGVLVIVPSLALTVDSGTCNSGVCNYVS